MSLMISTWLCGGDGKEAKYATLRTHYDFQPIAVETLGPINESATCYPRRSRSAIGVDIVLTLDVCLYVCMYVSALERKRLIGMT